MALDRDKTKATEARIVRAIWQHPRISRVGLAERLGLDKSTVTNQVNRLIERGLIEEIAEGDASARGGRKPIHLAVSRNFGTLIGIEIQSDSWTAVAVDLSGEILGELHGRADCGGEGFARHAAAVVEEARSLGRGRAPLLGVGVGVGGLVDPKRSVIRYSVPLGITKSVDFAKSVAASVPVPCLVENDANCCAWGELAFNRAEELRDFLFLLVEYRRDSPVFEGLGKLGVGIGIVLGGKVFSGSRGTAGEFRSSFCAGPGELQFSLSREELGRLDEDPEALDRALDELARNLAMLVNTFDIDRVYVGGDIESFASDFPERLKRRIEDNWMYPVPRSSRVLNSSLRGLAVAYGAAGMLLDRLVSGHGLSAPGAAGEAGA